MPELLRPAGVPPARRLATGTTLAYGFGTLLSPVQIPLEVLMFHWYRGLD